MHRLPPDAADRSAPSPDAADRSAPSPADALALLDGHDALEPAARFERIQAAATALKTLPEAHAAALAAELAARIDELSFVLLSRGAEALAAPLDGWFAARDLAEGAIAALADDARLCAELAAIAQAAAKTAAAASKPSNAELAAVLDDLREAPEPDDAAWLAEYFGALAAAAPALGIVLSAPAEALARLQGFAQALADVDFAGADDEPLRVLAFGAPVRSASDAAAALAHLPQLHAAELAALGLSGEFAGLLREKETIVRELAALGAAANDLADAQDFVQDFYDGEAAAVAAAVAAGEGAGARGFAAMSALERQEFLMALRLDAARFL